MSSRYSMPGKHADKSSAAYSLVRTIDPHKDASSARRKRQRIPHQLGRRLRAQCHARITRSPSQAAPEPGNHEIAVKTTRPKVTLSFRRRYYVGPMPDQVHARDRKAATEDIALGEAACWHASTPATLALTAHPMVTQGGN